MKGFSYAKHITAIINAIAGFTNLTMHFKLQLLQSYGETVWCYNRNTTFIAKCIILVNSFCFVEKMFDSFLDNSFEMFLCKSFC